MTIFAASEQESFDSVGSVAFETSGTFHDTSMTRGALRVGNSDTLTTTFVSKSDVWIHFKGYLRVANGNSGTSVTISGGGTDLVRIHTFSDASEGHDLEYWSGSAWISIQIDALSIAQLMDVDLHCNFAASGGEFTLYQDEVQVAQFTGDTTVGGSAVDTLTLSGTAVGSVDCFYSQVLISDTDTRGKQVETLVATADGVATAFTGTFADIDDEGLNDDGNSIEGVSDGAEQLFELGNPTVPSNHFISDLVFGSRSSTAAAGSQSMQFLTRSGSTNYASASVTGLDATLRPYQLIQTTDPDTGEVWDGAGISNIQAGEKAIDTFAPNNTIVTTKFIAYVVYRPPPPPRVIMINSM